jgi:hypothetical protein
MGYKIYAKILNEKLNYSLKNSERSPSVDEWQKMMHRCNI